MLGRRRPGSHVLLRAISTTTEPVDVSAGLRDGGGEVGGREAEFEGLR